MAQGARLPLALISLLMFRMAYAFYDVPQNAILAFATKTSRDRSRLAALRYIFGNLASLAVVLAFIPLLAAVQMGAKAQVFSAMAAGLCLVVIVSTVGLLYSGLHHGDPAVLGSGTARMKSAAAHHLAVWPVHHRPEQVTEQVALVDAITIGGV